MSRYFFVSLIFLFAATLKPVLAETFLECYPFQKVISDINFSQMIYLNNIESDKNMSIIDKINNKYYWKTRENRELLKLTSGIYDIFIDPKGGGYFKYDKINKIFIENVHLNSQVIIYTGKCK